MSMKRAAIWKGLGFVFFPGGDGENTDLRFHSEYPDIIFINTLVFI